MGASMGQSGVQGGPCGTIVDLLSSTCLPVKSTLWGPEAVLPVSAPGPSTKTCAGLPQATSAKG